MSKGYTMELDAFQALIKIVTSNIAGMELTASLAEGLNEQYPPDSVIFQNIQNACIAGIDDGWMCKNEHGGIKFGRVIKDVDGFSVDVVLMNNVVGPHHRHPNGEIDMVMPVSGNPKFDGNSSGWVVYEPGSAHKPTVTGGEAIVLYLLPDGEIEFTPS